MLAFSLLSVIASPISQTTSWMPFSFHSAKLSTLLGHSPVAQSLVDLVSDEVPPESGRFLSLPPAFMDMIYKQ